MSAAEDPKQMQQSLLQNDSQGATVIWEGVTWQGPLLLKCLSPVFCSNWSWRITSQRIDLTHGCCASEEDTFDLRRIEDMHFHRSLWQRCLNRGTIVIHQSNDELPELQLSTFYARDIFVKLKDAWMAARIATTIGHDGHMPV